jgi:hypothetical protein
MALPLLCRPGRVSFVNVGGAVELAEVACPACCGRELLRGCVFVLGGRRSGGMIIGDFDRARVTVVRVRERDRERLRRMRAVMAPKNVSSVGERDMGDTGEDPRDAWESTVDVRTGGLGWKLDWSCDAMVADSPIIFYQR